MGEAHARFQKRVALPIGLIVAGLIVAVIAMAFGFAHRQTSDAVADQRALTEDLISLRQAELEKLSNDYSFWDEAYENLVETLDPDWADANIGATLNHSYGIDLSFVLDPSGHTIYAMTNGRRAGIAIERILSGGIGDLLSDRTTGGPNASRGGRFMVGSAPAIAIVSPLRPFEKPDTKAGAGRYTLVLVDILAQPQLDALATTFRLPFLRSTVPGLEGEASTVWRTYDGDAPARLTWDGADPGYEMLRDLLPWVLAALGIFALLTFLVLRHASASARKLALSEHRASYDLLTGLRNRSCLFDHLDQARASWPALRGGYALLYIDLDGFKPINDTYGHDVGDEVLRLAAKRIEDAVPRQAHAYRLGGDEFAVVLPGTVAPVELRQIGERLIIALSDVMPIDGVTTRISATVGIAVAATAATDVIALLRRADQALYAGKRNGKASVQFEIDVTRESTSAAKVR